MAVRRLCAHMFHGFDRRQSSNISIGSMRQWSAGSLRGLQASSLCTWMAWIMSHKYQLVVPQGRVGVGGKIKAGEWLGSFISVPPCRRFAPVCLAVPKGKQGNLHCYPPWFSVGHLRWPCWGSGGQVGGGNVSAVVMAACSGQQAAYGPKKSLA